jgi:hypothetical protein
MTALLAKSWPVLVVAAVVGYCGWPAADAPGRLARKDAPAETAKPSRDSPSPENASLPVRDPFRPVEAPQANGSAVKAQKTPATMLAKGQKEKEKGQKDLPSRDGPGKADTAGKVDTTAAKAGKADLLRGLVLQAIFVQGERRITLINDRFYVEGAALNMPDQHVPPCIVAQIHRDKVLLKCQEQNMELKFAKPDKSHVLRDEQHR